MNANEITPTYSRNDAGRHVVVIGESQAATLFELIQLAPDLKAPEQIGHYCQALNHLKYGRQFRVIQDADAYRAKYAQRLQAEDPSAPWQEGVPRLSDYGICDTEEIQPPRRQNGSVVFYVEDGYLGIPYRVTAPAPDHPDGEVAYDLLPMSPLPDDVVAAPETSERDVLAVQDELAVEAPEVEPSTEVPPAQSAEPTEVAPLAETSVVPTETEPIAKAPPPQGESGAKQTPSVPPASEAVPAPTPVQEDEPSASTPTADETPAASPTISEETSAPSPPQEDKPSALRRTVDEAPEEIPAAAAPIEDDLVQDESAPDLSAQQPSAPEETPAPAPAPEPPKPDPHQVLKNAIAGDDMAAVKKSLLELQVDAGACAQILALWEEIAEPGTVKSERLEKMMELVSLIKALAVPKKVKDLLWMLQRRLIKYT